MSSVANLHHGVSQNSRGTSFQPVADNNLFDGRIN